MQLMDLYLLLHEHNKPLVNVIDNKDLLCSEDLIFRWVSHVALGEQQYFKCQCPICNLFTNGFISNNSATVLSVTATADQVNIRIADISTIYALLDFAAKLEEYISWCTNIPRLH